MIYECHNYLSGRDLLSKSDCEEVQNEAHELLSKSQYCSHIIADYGSFKFTIWHHKDALYKKDTMSKEFIEYGSSAIGKQNCNNIYSHQNRSNKAVLTKKPQNLPGLAYQMFIYHSCKS